MSTMGFTIRPHSADSHMQVLGYWWLGEDGKHLGFETNIVAPGDAAINALNLEQLAAAIREKDREHYKHYRGATKRFARGAAKK